jgi:hypothetical protein
MGAVLDLLKVLFEPTPVFERLREKPRFLAPFLVLAAFTVVIVLLQMPYTRAAIAAQLAQTPNVPPERAETAMKVGPIIGLVVAPIFYGLFLLINALILWMITSVLGGEGKFTTLLSVTTYASITYALLQVTSWRPTRRASCWASCAGSIRSRCTVSSSRRRESR